MALLFYKDLFKDQVALVTGGRSGIGFEIAKMMLQLGAQVIIASRKEGLLKEAHQNLSEYGSCFYQVCDIRSSESIQALVGFVQEKFGRLDILINNAGGQFPALAEMINDKGWNAVINNNLNGTFYMTREMSNAFFIPQKSGSIVNIIVSVFRGLPGMAHTGAARAGIENMTKTLAVEWSEHRIRLNCVAPGIIDSSGLEQYPQEIIQLFDKAKKIIPLGRFGTVQDVAHAVCFLSSPLASYINGTTLYVDGAQHLHFDFTGLTQAIKSFLKE